MPKGWKKEGNEQKMRSLTAQIHRAARENNIPLTTAEKHVRGSGRTILEGTLLGNFIASLGGGNEYEKIRREFTQLHM
jgi:hypothetical protein